MQKKGKIYIGKFGCVGNFFTIKTLLGRNLAILK